MSSDSPTDINAGTSKVDTANFEMYGDQELDLSRQQVEFITADSPTRLEAGPGAGKTTTTGLRIEYLIKMRRIPASRILVMAYNDEAAQQLRADLVKYLGEVGQEVTVMTFHKFASRCLKQEIGHRTDLGSDFQKVPEYHRNRLINRATDAVVGDLWDQLDKCNKADPLEAFIRKMKSTGKNPEYVASYFGLVRGQCFHKDILRYLDYWIERLDVDFSSHCWPLAATHSDSEVAGREAITAQLTAVLSVLDQPQEATTADLSPAAEEDGQTVVGAINDELDQAATILTRLQTVLKTGSAEDRIQAAVVATRLLGGSISSKKSVELPEQFEPGIPAMALADRFRARKQEVLLAMALQPAYQAYQDLLNEGGFVDYNDIIVAAANALDGSDGNVVTEQYSHVVVDEFQDSTAMQFRIADAIAGDANEITMTGDPCQTLYEWRTAFRENFTRRPERIYGDELTTIKLQANRRAQSADLRNVVNTLLDHTRTDLDPVEQLDPTEIPIDHSLPDGRNSTPDWGEYHG